MTTTCTSLRTCNLVRIEMCRHVLLQESRTSQLDLLTGKMSLFLHNFHSTVRTAGISWILLTLARCSILAFLSTRRETTSWRPWKQARVSAVLRLVSICKANVYIRVKSRCKPWAGAVYLLHYCVTCWNRISSASQLWFWASGSEPNYTFHVQA